MTASDPPQLPPPPRRLSPAGVVAIYVLFSALWIVSSDLLLTFSVADPVLQSRIELAKGLLFVSVTGGLLYLLLRECGYPRDDAATYSVSDIPYNKNSRLVMLFVAPPLIGSAIYMLHGSKTERDAMANLLAIANLKAGQIENWLDERWERWLGLTACNITRLAFV